MFNSSNHHSQSLFDFFAHGASVTLTGTVAPGSGGGTPTGDVAFIVSSGAIGDPVNPFDDGSLNGPVAFATLSGGSYTANLNNLPGGTYYVTARYGGDTTFASSYSAPVQVTVSSEGSPGLTITPYALCGSACTITGASSFAYGSDILRPERRRHLRYWHSNWYGGPDPRRQPYGTLTLDPNGNAFILSGAITSSSCIYDYNSANVATFAGGSHTITASYSGDASYSASTATPVSITVTQLTPTLTLTPAGGGVITSGTTVPLTATFSGLTGINGNSNLSAAPTGVVTFTDTTTSTVLGTAPIVAIALFSGNNYTYSAYATLTTTGITASGANAITASFAGDSNWGVQRRRRSPLPWYRHRNNHCGYVERKSDHAQRASNLHGYGNHCHGRLGCVLRRHRIPGRRQHGKHRTPQHVPACVRRCFLGRNSQHHRCLSGQRHHDGAARRRCSWRPSPRGR